MKRKVVQQGPATLMISLPSKWVKENNISKGDEIELFEEKGKLTLSLGNVRGSEESKKEFDVRTFGIFNEYFVNYFYQKGYDEITIRYDDPKYTGIIEQRVKQMMGFEVVDKGKNHTTIKILMKTDEQEFETLLRKLFQITMVMGDKLGEALEKNRKELLEEVKADEKENNKYCDLCLRILFKNRYKYPENSFVLFSLLRELEQVGDIYKYLAEDFQNAKTANKEIIGLYKEVHAFFRMYYSLYYSFDAAKAQAFFQQKPLLLSACQKQANEATKEDVLVIAHLTSLIHSVFDLKGPLFLMKV